MNPNEIKRLREKHRPVFQNIGRAGDVNYCEGCKGPIGTLTVLYPCEVTTLLDAYENDVPTMLKPITAKVNIPNWEGLLDD